MYRRTYQVKGEDVNDFMVMQNFAYLTYASRSLESFLFEKGYTKRKLGSLKMGLQERSGELIYQKHLMFTQIFSVNLEFSVITDNKGKMSVKHNFYNEKNELCAMVINELYWFDYSCGEIVAPPKKIMEPFLIQKTNMRG